jgi:allantoin racemase
MRILWLGPIGTDAFDVDTARILKEARREGTVVDVLSLPSDRPIHLEYHAYEGLVTSDIVRVVHSLSATYDGIVIGCFYDVGLREAREVSRRAIVTAPCQASLLFASHLGNTLSVLVGRRKWIPKMKENIEAYGYGSRLVSMRPLGLGVHDFQADTAKTSKRLLEEGRIAVEEDGAEVLILGCTAEYGFCERMQEVLGVPVIDAVLAPFKLAEALAETAEKFGWYPSRKWGSQAPPSEEVDAWGLFKGDPPIGNLIKDEQGQ